MADRNDAGNNSSKESSKCEEQRAIDRAPFRNLRITDASVLNMIEGRKKCEFCQRSRKFFCYTCCTPIIDRRYFPRVKLPIKIDIIKHPCEIDGKSTAVHAAILAPDDVTIYTYPRFPQTLDKEEVIPQTVLIFPSKDVPTVSVEALFGAPSKGEDDNDDDGSGGASMRLHPRTRRQFPIKRAVFIDSTWQQTKSIYRDRRLKELRCVMLSSRISQFWRHHKKSPRWYLSTIEAIHQFLVELHTCAFGAVDGYADLVDDSVPNTERQDSTIDEERTNECLEETCRRYDGQYDDLLYFFKYMYDKIHAMYDHDRLLAYKRPLI